jgi:hypothetical protein
MGLFVVPTVSFRLLYGLLILRHDRRRLLWLGPPHIQPRNGSPSSSSRPADGTGLPGISSVIAIDPIVRYLYGVLVPCADLIYDRHRRNAALH